MIATLEGNRMKLMVLLFCHTIYGKIQANTSERHWILREHCWHRLLHWSEAGWFQHWDQVCLQVWEQEIEMQSEAATGQNYVDFKQIEWLNANIGWCFTRTPKKMIIDKDRLGWAELFLQNGTYVVQKISNFAGSGAQQVAEFFTSDVGGRGDKFGRNVVSKGKKVANRRDRSGCPWAMGRRSKHFFVTWTGFPVDVPSNQSIFTHANLPHSCPVRVKCKLSNLLGGSCGRSGGTPSSCGDGTEYVIKNEQDWVPCGYLI